MQRRSASKLKKPSKSARKQRQMLKKSAWRPIRPLLSPPMPRLTLSVNALKPKRLSVCAKRPKLMQKEKGARQMRPRHSLSRSAKRRLRRRARQASPLKVLTIARRTRAATRWKK